MIPIPGKTIYHLGRAGKSAASTGLSTLSFRLPPHGFGRPLPREFYLQDVRDLAQLLLGAVVLRFFPAGSEAGDLNGSCMLEGHWLAGRIVETEAYYSGDPASHAFRGITPRNAVMFGPPGHAYVYTSYGIHSMLNIVCQPEGVAEAILIRAIEPLAGEDILAANRGMSVIKRELTAGPGRLTAALAIDRGKHDGADLTDSCSVLQISGPTGGTKSVVTTTRIGLSIATDKPLRYYVRDNTYVSRK